MNECMFARKICLTDCGMENCALVLILLMKNVAKLSVIKADEGGGVGGQRSEENVLKNMQELDKLFILL